MEGVQRSISDDLKSALTGSALRERDRRDLHRKLVFTGERVHVCAGVNKQLKHKNVK